MMTKSMQDVMKRTTLGLGAVALLVCGCVGLLPNVSLAAGPAGVTNAALWLDAAQLTGLNNGDTVSFWTDMSGSGNHPSATGSAATYQTNALNGQPVVRFNPDGNASFNFTRIGGIRTVFWVLKKYAENMPFLLGDSETYHFHAGFSRGSTIWSHEYAAAQHGTTKLMGTPVDGTWAQLPVGSYSLLSLVTIQDVSLQANQLTADRTIPGRSWNGDIAEVVIYTRALSAAEEIKVGAYLAAKYGLQTEYPVPGMLYWDGNGSTAGFGTTSGTWAAPTLGSATQGWSTNYLGETMPADTTTSLADRLYFGYGATGLGAGTVTVDNTVAASNITFGAASGAVTLSGGTITLADTTFIRVDNASDTIISSVLAGASNSLTKAGGGALHLYGANSYTGATTVAGGQIVFQNGASVGATRKITVNYWSKINFQPGVRWATISTPLELSGEGNSGAGRWDAAALYTYAEGGEITFSGPVTLLGYAAIKAFAANSILRFTGAIGGTGPLLLNGGGGGDTHKDYFVLSGASTFTGDLHIANVGSSAQVTLSGGDDRLPVTAVVRMGSGWGWNANVISALDLNGCNQTLAGLSIDGNWNGGGPCRVVNTSGTAATLTLNTSADHSFSGNLGGTDIAGTAGNNLALVKIGSGMQTLTGACTYTGSTAVSNGVLTVTGTQVLPTATDVYISTASGAKLELAFEGTTTVRRLYIDNELQERNKVYSAVNRPLVLAGAGFLAVTEGTSGGMLMRLY